VVSSGGDERGETRDGLGPGGGDGDAKLGHLVLGGVEPDGVGAGLLQQPVAIAQGALQRRDAGAVIGVDRQHKPVEKAAAVARRAREQAVHGRRQPNEAQMVGEGARRGDGGAIDAAFASGGGEALGGLQPRAELGEAVGALQLDRDGEAAAPACPRHIGEIGAAQSAALREQRQGLDEIGLAGAIVAGQRGHGRVEAQIEGGVGAEIAEHDATHPAQGRIGRIDRSGKRAHGACFMPAKRPKRKIRRASASAHRARRRRRDPAPGSASRGRRA
jgi:hypothetical protein